MRLKVFLGLILFMFAFPQSRQSFADDPLVLERDRLVALINGETITYSQLLQRSRLSTHHFRKLEETKDPRARVRMVQFMQQKLQDLVREKLLFQEARRRKVSLDKTDEKEVELKLKDLAEPYNGLPGLEKKLREKGITIKVLRDEIRSSILTGKVYYSAITRNIFISPRRIRDYYKENRTSFIRTAKTQLRRIRITTEPDDLTEAGEEWLKRSKKQWSPETCKQLANELRTQILNGADPGQLAAKYTMRISEQENGGLFEFKDPINGIARVEGLTGVDEVANTMKEGEVSKLLKTRRGGYDLIVLVLRRERVILPFSAVQDKIVRRLKEQEWQLQIKEFILKLRRAAKIKLFLQSEP